MIVERHATALVTSALHNKLHDHLLRAVFLQVDGGGSCHSTVHCEGDGQAFHFLVALVDDAHIEVVGQAWLHHGRSQPHGIDV